MVKKKLEKRSHHSGGEKPAPKGKDKLHCMTIAIPCEPDVPEACSPPGDTKAPCEVIEAELSLIVVADASPIQKRVEMDALLTGHETYWMGKKYNTIVAVLPGDDPVLQPGEVRKCKIILEPPAVAFDGNKSCEEGQ